jgi:hypothetical protein
MWRAVFAVVAAAVLVAVVVRPDVAKAVEDEPGELRPMYVIGPSDMVVDFISASEEPRELALDLTLVHGAPVEVLLVPVEAVTFPEELAEGEKRHLLVDDALAVERRLLVGEERIVLVAAPEQMYGLVMRTDDAFGLPAPGSVDPEAPEGSGVAVVFGYPDEDVRGARIVAYVMMAPGLVLLAGLAYRDVRRRRAPLTPLT